MDQKRRTAGAVDLSVLIMALLFAAAARRYETAPEEYEAVFRDLAREEIIENGNWMSYCKEDRPTFSL